MWKLHGLLEYVLVRAADLKQALNAEKMNHTAVYLEGTKV